MTLLGLHWQYPLFFLLLPLAILPWVNHNLDKTVAWVKLVPVDPLSRGISLALKTLASIVIICLSLALTQPYQPETTIDRIGEGAEIVLLLDRSRSMDDPFAVKTQAAAVSVGGENSKRSVSKRYLTEFLRKRPDDRFGFVFFSDRAFRLLPLTYSKEATLSTVEASALGKGLSDTNVADALVEAARMYEGEVYRGSRIVLLVSDGGQKLNEEQQERIAKLYKRMNLTVYWIYLRSMDGMTLGETDNDNALFTNRPERKLHDFFKTMDVPYRAFEAGSLEEFSDAMDQIDEQQYETLVVQQVVPRQYQSDIFLWLAMLAMLLLAASHLYTWYGVRKAHE